MGGRMAFITIHPAGGLKPSDHRKALRYGPVAVATRRPMRSLLAAAGFSVIEEVDYTEEFLITLEGWIDQWELYRSELETIWGRDVVDERQQERRGMIRVTGAGLLRRTMFIADRSQPKEI